MIHPLDSKAVEQTSFVCPKGKSTEVRCRVWHLHRYSLPEHLSRDQKEPQGIGSGSDSTAAPVLSGSISTCPTSFTDFFERSKERTYAKVPRGAGLYVQDKMLSRGHASLVGCRWGPLSFRPCGQNEVVFTSEERWALSPGSSLPYGPKCNLLTAALTVWRLMGPLQRHMVSNQLRPGEGGEREAHTWTRGLECEQLNRWKKRLSF